MQLPPPPPKELILAVMPGPGLKEAKSGVKSKKVLGQSLILIKIQEQVHHSESRIGFWEQDPFKREIKKLNSFQSSSAFASIFGNCVNA